LSPADSLALLGNVIRACNDELAWNLNEEHVQSYTTALARCLDPATPPDLLRAAAVNYHADHALVAAMRDALHPGHDSSWDGWMRQVLGVLRRAGVAWSDDPAIDLEDLAQVARAELARALPAYRFQSRFSSWAYRVVVQSAARQIRHARAEKRSARPDSLHQAPGVDALVATVADPELAAQGRLLAERVAAVLAAQPDRRLLSIFQQWALEERGTAEIGAVVRLHPSRVRALLAQARQALRADPVIQAWYAGERRDEAA
jgi:RNA polymerase sigma factor (sigma-70 family)